MKITKTKIEGLLIIEPDLFYDNRGYFFESFNKKKYNEIGITCKFVQDNESCSQKGTIRGLHYQIGAFAQCKLVRVVSGSVIDYAVDIRFDSPTFGKFVAVELTSENKKQFWIPTGFAHGFEVLVDNSIVLYKCTKSYSKSHERGIIYNDPEIGINWKNENILSSEKDKNNSLLVDIEKDFIFEQ